MTLTLFAGSAFASNVKVKTTDNSATTTASYQAELPRYEALPAPTVEEAPAPVVQAAPAPIAAKPAAAPAKAKKGAKAERAAQKMTEAINKTKGKVLSGMGGNLRLKAEKLTSPKADKAGKLDGLAKVGLILLCAGAGAALLFTILAYVFALNGNGGLAIVFWILAVLCWLAATVGGILLIIGLIRG